MNQNRRVVVVSWKSKPYNTIEVFSSLKNFCISYPKYNYNTLSNYLSKAKIPYETDELRVERKDVFLQPKIQLRKIMPIVRKVAMKEANDYAHDLNYWMGKTPAERLSGLTLLVRQSIKKGQRLDKTHIVRRALNS
ncbi:MAG: hypothetical protein WBJ10_02090 [Daejeonella sp.]|uniref:hypothetical protein n=1 Tax=Daejeonella sp. TaxID=2805397 RepID=UPI003C742E64